MLSQSSTPDPRETETKRSNGVGPNGQNKHAENATRFKMLVDSCKDVALCPFLGIRADADTHCRYPSVENCCYGCRKAEPIPLELQNTHCLASEYVRCKVFINYTKKQLEASLGQGRQVTKANGVRASLMSMLLGIK